MIIIPIHALIPADWGAILSPCNLCISSSFLNIIISIIKKKKNTRVMDMTLKYVHTCITLLKRYPGNKKWNKGSTNSISYESALVDSHIPQRENISSPFVTTFVCLFFRVKLVTTVQQNEICYRSHFHPGMASALPKQRFAG